MHAKFWYSPRKNYIFFIHVTNNLINLQWSILIFYNKVVKYWKVLYRIRVCLWQTFLLVCYSEQYNSALGSNLLWIFNRQISSKLLIFKVGHLKTIYFTLSEGVSFYSDTLWPLATVPFAVAARCPSLDDMCSWPQM